MNNDLNNPEIKFKTLEGWNWKTMSNKFAKRFPAHKDMTLSSTRNTTHPCPMCYTTRFSEIHHTNGQVTIKTCPRCKGTNVIRY